MTVRIRAMAALLACAVLGACGGSESPRPTDTATSAEPAAPATAQKALARGGLELPSETSDLTYGILDVDGNRETYVVTFRTAHSAAIDICDTAGLGGALPVLKLSDTDRVVFGNEANPGDGARYCSSIWPESTSWNRTVLIEPGDPALVRIAVMHLSR